MLGLVVTEHLFARLSGASEGQLAKLRAAVVNSRALADVARDLGLGALVRLGRGEETTGGRDKSSILADTMEAVIGAVFIEHGIEAARVFVHYLFDDLMADVATRGAGLDWKTSLQEISSLAGLGVPIYQIVESGPDHAKSFQAMVVIAESTLRPRAGRNKKEAEQNAAAGLRRPEERGRTGVDSGRRRIRCRARPSPTRCRSCPRSRWSGAVWPPASTDRTIAAVEVLHPRPVRRHLAGAEDFATVLVGRTFAEPRRRGKYLWLPLTDGDAAARPPGHERAVPARADRDP